jgi:hypothetical protein
MAIAGNDVENRTYWGANEALSGEVLSEALLLALVGERGTRVAQDVRKHVNKDGCVRVRVRV